MSCLQWVSLVVKLVVLQALLQNQNQVVVLNLFHPHQHQQHHPRLQHLLLLQHQLLKSQIQKVTNGTQTQMSPLMRQLVQSLTRKPHVKITMARLDLKSINQSLLMMVHPQEKTVHQTVTQN